MTMKKRKEDTWMVAHWVGKTVAHWVATMVAWSAAGSVDL